jgi:hypothetical protein
MVTNILNLSPLFNNNNYDNEYDNIYNNIYDNVHDNIDNNVYNNEYDNEYTCSSINYSTIFYLEEVQESRFKDSHKRCFLLCILLPMTQL